MELQTDDLKFDGIGAVVHPPNLRQAAEASLGNRDLVEFLARYGEHFTVEQLCKFCDERNAQ